MRKKLQTHEKLVIWKCWCLKKCWWTMLMISKKVISRSDHCAQHIVNFPINAPCIVIIKSFDIENHTNISGLQSSVSIGMLCLSTHWIEMLFENSFNRFLWQICDLCFFLHFYRFFTFRTFYLIVFFTYLKLSMAPC